MRKMNHARQRLGGLLVGLPWVLLLCGILLSLQPSGGRATLAQSFDVAATVTSLVQTREAIHIVLTAAAIQRGEVATPTPAATRTPATDVAGQNTSPIVEIRVSGLNVRSGPGTNYPIIGRATAGERFPIIGRSANCAWLQIAREGGGSSWISGGAQYVSYTAACDSIALASP